MTIIQNLLSIQTSAVSDTTESGQELFEYARTEIISIPFEQILPNTASNLTQNSATLANGVAYNTTSGSDQYISLPFNVRYNGLDLSAVRLAADSYLVFTAASTYSHNSSPDYTISGTIPYSKIFVNTNTANSFYGESGDLNTYGYNGCIKIDAGTSPNRTVKLIYTGYRSSKSAPLIWSVTFYERQNASDPSYMDFHINNIHSNSYNQFHDRSRLFKNFPIEAGRGYRVISTVVSDYIWTCPEGVYEVSAVCIGGGGGGAGGSSGASGSGGGGLGWKNNISVTPGSNYGIKVGNGGARFTSTTSSLRAGTGGQSYFINSSTVAGNGGQGGITNGSSFGTGGSYTGTNGGNGGNGGTRSTATDAAGGGGGAGGYTGNGGNGGYVSTLNPESTQNGSSGSGGGGGGGGKGGSNLSAGSGGGVGVYGQGNNGSGGAGSSSLDGIGGGGGSNGESATSVTPYDDSPYQPSRPGNYGGGGCGSDSTILRIDDGAKGAVRLIWGPRFNRQFPSSNTQDLYVTYRYIKWEISSARNSSSVQVSEFKFLYNHSDIIYLNNTSISSVTGSNPNNLIDYSTTTKFTDSTLSSILTFDLQSALNITGYKWSTADNDTNQDPKSWILYGSNDGDNWTEIDRVTNYTAPSNRQTSTRIFYLPVITR